MLSKDEIEAVARAICPDKWDARDFNETATGESPKEQREYWLGIATAALTAAEPFFKQDRKDEWQPIETAPKDEPFLAAVEVRNNKTGERWWDRHVIWIDGETEEVHHDTDAGWAAGDYTHWMPLPPPPPLAVISAKAIRSLSEQEEGDDG